MTEAQIAAPGSYREYKRDTTIFLAWLQIAAQACGYKVGEPSSQVERYNADARVLVRRKLEVESSPAGNGGRDHPRGDQKTSQADLGASTYGLSIF